MSTEPPSPLVPPDAEYQGTRTGIILTCSYSFSLIPAVRELYQQYPPELLIDGHPKLAQWGRNWIPLPPGRYHLAMRVPNRTNKRSGATARSVVVPPGPAIELEYRTPVFPLVPGALGPPPQRANGWVPLWIMIGAILALPLLLSCVLVGLQRLS